MRTCFALADVTGVRSDKKAQDGSGQTDPEPTRVLRLVFRNHGAAARIRHSMSGQDMPAVGVTTTMSAIASHASSWLRAWSVVPATANWSMRCSASGGITHVEGWGRGLAAIIAV